MKRFTDYQFAGDARHTGLLCRLRRGFTLIELLVVVVILSILAVIAVPQFSSAAEDSGQIGTLRQLQMLRSQIEVFRNREGREPDLLGSQWDDLLDNDYLMNPPYNLLNRTTAVGAAPGPGIGWVWRDKGNGTFSLYATDLSQFAELPG